MQVGRKGFVFTIDAMLALAIVSAALAGIAALASHNSVEANSLAAFGRSFLEQRHFHGSAITEAEAGALAGFTVNASAPTQGTAIARSVLFAYPSELAGCGCAASGCALAAGVNDSCLSSQEGLSGMAKQAWVSK
jgi:hypothetical protein